MSSKLESDVCCLLPPIAAFRFLSDNPTQLRTPFAACPLDTNDIVVGNEGDNSVSSYRLHASETQQLSYYVPMADATRHTRLLSVWSC